MTYSHPSLAADHAAAQRGQALARDAFSVELQPAADAPDGALTPPEWVHLIPAGTFSGRDGRGPYRLDARAVLDAFAAHGADLPVDYDHQSLEAEAKAGPVPAAGWIKELSAREDGIWARVEWTPAAAQHLTNKEYRYLSPVFRYDRKTGRVVALDGAGLTHNPNLYLKAAASRKETHAVEDDILERLIVMLNLPVTATADDVAAELQKLIDRLTAAEAAAQAAQSRQPDPAEYVPVAMHRQVAEQLAALQAEVARRDAEAAVSEAMSARKIAPALKDWALAYASRDLEGFKAFVAAAPEIVPEGELRRTQSAHAALLTDEDRLAAKLLGIDEAAFAAHKQTLIKE
ncbi:phage protease [Thiobacter aerophilum]|uniref:Phage protease n=1 Tax=Thiobacter aerophilum TaxID=3121275 RepID=A0ABV0EDP2_9BURK